MDHLLTIFVAIFIIVLNFCSFFFFLKTWEYRFLKIYVIHAKWILGKNQFVLISTSRRGQSQFPQPLQTNL